MSFSTGENKYEWRVNENGLELFHGCHYRSVRAQLATDVMHTKVDDERGSRFNRVLRK